jgi:hypothetical protein
MATVNVLVAVDVQAALASGNLQNNVYMVDTNHFLGSYQEGTSELITTLAIGDTIVWTVSPIDPGTNVSINSFTGVAINNQYINPVVDPLSSTAWESRFQPPGGTSVGTQFQYSIVLSFGSGKTMTFDPFLQVGAA